MINLTAEMLRTLINAVLTIAGILLTAYAIPWLKEKIGAEKLSTLESYIIYAVRCAEQIYQDNKEKKQYVYNYILKKSEDLCLNLTPADIDLMIEGAVNLIKKGE
ncbi:MAG: phage holin family protein [Lachnospiraceae bacterium]|nr:phage holin family protein [Lachnospiraceae bacterium]